MDCIFCKIIAGEIPSTKVYEDENILAFKDINPFAPVHVLVIPKMHIKSAREITEENAWIVAEIFKVIAKLSAELDVKDGFRVVTNCEQHGCQSVDHLHFHLIGGKQLDPKLG